MLASHPLLATGELYLDYGESFWKIQRERMAEVKVWQQDPEVQGVCYVLFLRKDLQCFTVLCKHTNFCTVHLSDPGVNTDFENCSLSQTAHGAYCRDEHC